MKKLISGLVYSLLSHAVFSAILVLLVVLFIFDADQYRYKWFAVAGLAAFIVFGFFISKYVDVDEPDGE